MSNNNINFDLTQQGQNISPKVVNQLINEVKKQPIATTNGVVGYDSKFVPEKINQSNPSQENILIKNKGVSLLKRSSYGSGQSGTDAKEFYAGSYIEAGNPIFPFENGLITYSGLYTDSYMLREVCDNPTAKEAFNFAFRTDDEGFFAYKATASIAPVSIIGLYNNYGNVLNAAWKSLAGNSWNSIPDITDMVSGNIEVRNLYTQARNFSEDFCTFPSGLSGELSGYINIWAERISDNWYINLQPVPTVSGLVVWDIETAQYIVDASDQLYKCYMPTSGDDNNYKYGWEWPRLCDI